MAITTPQIEDSEFSNTRHHSNLDKNTRNMHHPIGFRSADVGTYLFKDETGNYTYEPVSYTHLTLPTNREV